MKLSEVVKKVLALTQAIRDYWDEVLPKRHPNYPLVEEGADDGPPPPEEKKLRDLLGRLPEEQVFQILLLTHLGRGSVRVENLQAGYERIRSGYETKANALTELLGGPLLEDLEDGLAALNQADLDADEALSRRVAS